MKSTKVDNDHYDEAMMVMNDSDDNLGESRGNKDQFNKKSKFYE